MGAYQTRQKKALLAFFRQHSERAYAIEEIVSLLGREGSGGLRMGRSTVYRLVPEFVADGTLRRFSPDGARGSRYQYVGGAACAGHLHLKCTQCGALFHLTQGLSEDIFQQIRRDVGLSLNKAETILLGTCGQCGNS